MAFELAMAKLLFLPSVHTHARSINICMEAMLPYLFVSVFSTTLFWAQLNEQPRPLGRVEVAL